jgi:plastocyanin
VRPRGPQPIALGLAATIAALAGCGGSSKQSSQPAAGASTPTAATSARVVMGDYFFRPPRITVKVGQPLTFVNEGKIEHTVADTTPSGQIRSRLIKPRPLATGQTQRVIFHAPGTVTYLCTFHPTLMSGRITVVKD